MRKPAVPALLLLTACSGTAASVDPADGAGEAVAITRECRVPSPAAPAALHTVRDITYAVMDGQPQRLDLAVPRSPGPHPLAVLIHGGGWSGGHRSAYHGAMRLLAAEGYATASIDYRLAAAPRNVFPAAVEDVRCAVRWLRSHSEELGIDPTRIAAMGSSAGGHLSAMLGTATDVEGLDGACPLRDVSPAVSAVIAVAGPHDIRTTGPLDSGQRSMVENFLGIRPESDPARALLASPAVHATAGDPPFLLIHGTADGVVPVEQSRGMLDTLRGAEVPATLVELPGVGHTFPELGGGRRRVHGPAGAMFA